MRKILIVEDDPTLRDVYHTILSTQPYLCDTATNGKEAIEKCQKQQYDLILLDLMMPVMSGIEFLDNYNDLETMKSKIIILSNLSSGKELDRARQMGILKNFIKSDLSPSELISAIKFDLETA